MSKTVYYIAASAGGTIGGWLPSLWGAGLLSPWSILGSVVGGILGIVVAYQIGKYF